MSKVEDKKAKLNLKALQNELEKDYLTNGHTKEFERKWDELQWLKFGRRVFRIFGRAIYLKGLSVKFVK